VNLNKQLVCVSLLLLSLPWAGCQYLKEMDHSLRLGQEANLEATSKVIAQALAQNPANLHPHGQVASTASKTTGNNAFYCHPLEAPIWADGYDEEWLEVPWTDYQSEDGQNSVRYRCAVSGNSLALFFSVPDEQVIYNNPIQSLASNGDRLVLATGSGRNYIFTAVAPGTLTARYLNNAGKTYRESRIDASWADHDTGYQLEIKMPLALAQGRLSFEIIDESSQENSRFGPLLETEKIPWFAYQAPASEQAIAAFSQPGLHLRLTTPAGWLIASAGNPESQGSSQAHWLLSKLYRTLLSSSDYANNRYQNGVNYTGHQEFTGAQQGTVTSHWYRDPQRSDHHILSTAMPIKYDGEVIAILIAEQSSEQTAGLTDQAFSRLFLLSFSVISLTALALLGYANWLSWRIRRLHRATQQALLDPNNIIEHHPTSRANDEIDQLTNSYSELMKRIQEYTDYLQTLARKLSHELRTPLAIINSSLDNLSSQTLDEQSRTYQQRAKDGTLRLGSLITAMSEAKRVEESIEQAELEKINITELLREITEAYRDTYQENRFRLTGIDSANIEHPENFLIAAPELLVQMLDKLIDNACSFTPPDGEIEITYQATDNAIHIDISNDGPLLPEAMQSQLFDNLVSMREAGSDETHLGMGLHIVDLIVKFHGGEIRAYNHDDKSGVVFSLLLPRSH
jgi:two-component system, OmpR family, sensor histidine kinase ChvG